MAVRVAGLEADAVAGAQDLLAGIGDQRDLAPEHEHELVLVRVPVAQAGHGPRREIRQVHAELVEAE
jgi:hypothetical protein